MAKATHAQAKYRPRPNGEDYCARCTMFRPGPSCTAVVDPITARGWCEYFKRAAAPRKPQLRAALKGTH